MALVVGVSLVGCGTDDPTPTAAAQITCVDQAFRAGLHVDARDPRKVWATDYDTGRDVAVRPRPPGQFVFDVIPAQRAPRRLRQDRVLRWRDHRDGLLRRAIADAPHRARRRSRSQSTTELTTAHGPGETTLLRTTQADPHVTPVPPARSGGASTANAAARADRAEDRPHWTRRCRRPGDIRHRRTHHCVRGRPGSVSLCALYCRSAPVRDSRSRSSASRASGWSGSVSRSSPGRGSAGEPRRPDSTQSRHARRVREPSPAPTPSCPIPCAWGARPSSV